MKALGPLLGIGLTLDWHLAMLVTWSNLAFAAATVLLFFRGRKPLDRILIGVGLFAIIGSVSLWALYSFAQTPVRDIQVFLVD